MNVTNNNKKFNIINFIGFRMSKYMYITNISILHKIFNFFTSFGFLFAAFVWSTRIKSDPRLEWIPVDLTLLFFIISVVRGMPLILRMKIKSTILLIFFVFLFFSLWLFISVLWSPISEYSVEKLIRFMTLSVWSFTASIFVISQNKQKFYEFLYSWIFFSAISIIESYYYYISIYLSIGSFEPRTGRIFGGDYIGMGANLSITIITLFIMVSKRFNLFYFLLIIFSFIVILLIGSRSAFISLLISYFVIAIFYKKIKVFYIIFFIILFGFLSSIWLPSATILRLQWLAYGSPEEFVRLWYYSKAVEMFESSPIIGWGIGSFDYYWRLHSPTFVYPHNIFLEIASETGIIGSILFCLFLFCIVYVFLFQYKIYGKEILVPELLISMSIVLISLFISLFSYDINSNRLLWISLGIFIGILIRIRQYIISRNIINKIYV